MSVDIVNDMMFFCIGTLKNNCQIPRNNKGLLQNTLSNDRAIAEWRRDGYTYLLNGINSDT